jgi:hypothetical protein
MEWTGKILIASQLEKWRTAQLTGTSSRGARIGASRR